MFWWCVWHNNFIRSRNKNFQQNPAKVGVARRWLCSGLSTSSPKVEILSRICCVCSPVMTSILVGPDSHLGLCHQPKISPLWTIASLFDLKRSMRMLCNEQNVDRWNYSCWKLSHDIFSLFFQTPYKLENQAWSHYLKTTYKYYTTYLLERTKRPMAKQCKHKRPYSLLELY